MLHGINISLRRSKNRATPPPRRGYRGGVAPLQRASCTCLQSAPPPGALPPRGKDGKHGRVLTLRGESKRLSPIDPRRLTNEIADHLWRSATPDRLVLSRCWGHWIAISLNSRSFCRCQHHNTHNTNLIDGPSDDAVKRGRGFWLQACGRSPACFKVVSPPAQSLRVHQKSVLNVLWC